MIIADRKQCTGCGACSDICPAGCISMDTSEEGFFFPAVDESRCMDCGACRTICPALNPSERHSPKKAFAAWALDESVRTTSSSGGVYSILGEHILEQGGAVSGCRFDGELVLKQELYDRPGDTVRFRGSKYVQCFPNGIYRKVKQELSNGRTVLFFGPPCQVAAMRNYLGRPYDSLVVCDLVCHGVPSQKIFRSYLERHHLSPDPGRSVIAFRDLKGWGDYYIRILEQDAVQWRSDDSTNEFIRAFLSGYCSNEACYECPYACMERTGDLTLADFWGLGKDIPFDGDPSQGCSLVLINTEKGEMMLHAVQDKLFLKERTPEEARLGNGQLRAPIRRQPMRDVFYQMDWAEIAPKINYRKASPLRKLLRACKRKLLDLSGLNRGRQD